MPAAPLILAYAGASGLTAAIGTSLAAAIGVSSIGTIAATAIGTAALSGGLTAIQGGSVSNILKSAVIGGVTSYAGGAIAAEVSQSISSDVFFQAIGSDVSGATAKAMSDVAGNMAGAMASGAFVSGFQALAAGKDPVQALLKGGLTAGITAGVGSTLDATLKGLGIDSSRISTTFTRAASAAIASELLGGSTEKAFLGSLTSSAISTVGQYLGGTFNNPVLKDASAGVSDVVTRFKNVESDIQENAYQQDLIVRQDTRIRDSLQTRATNLQSRIDYYNANEAAYDYDGRYSARLRADAATLQADVETYKTTTRPALEAKIADYKDDYDDLTESLGGLQKELTTAISEFQVQELANAAKVSAAFNAVAEIKDLYKEAKGVDIPDSLLAEYLPAIDPAKNVANDPTSINGLVQEINVRKEVPDFDEASYKAAMGRSWDRSFNPYAHFLETGKDLDIPTNAEDLAKYNELKEIAANEGYTLKPEDIKLYREFDNPDKANVAADLTEQLDKKVLTYSELSQIEAEEGISLTYAERDALLKTGGTEEELSSKVRGILDPRYFSKSEAEQALIEAGIDPALAKSQAWWASGKDDSKLAGAIDSLTLDADEVLAIAKQEGLTLTREEAEEIAKSAGSSSSEYNLEKKITSTLDARGITYNEAYNAAAAEGHTLTPDEFKQFAGKAGSEADLLTQVQGYADNKYTTRAEAEQALIDAGFDPEFAKQQALSAQGVGEGRVADVVNRYTLDADEVLAIAAKEGATLTREQAQEIANRAGVGFAYDLEGKITPDLDALGLTFAEAANIAAEEGYTLTDKDFERFKGQAGSETELFNQVRTYADEKYTTQDEAKQLLLDAGLSEEQAEEEAWFVSGAGDRTAATKQVSDRYIIDQEEDISVPILSLDAEEAAKRLTDIQAVAVQEGVKLSEADLSKYLQSDDSIEDLQQELDASKLTREELQGIADRHGYTLTDEDVTKFANTGETYVDSYFDNAVTTADEMRDYAATLVPEGFELSDTEIQQLGSGDEATIRSRLASYVDQNYIDEAELRAEAQKYGYTLSDEDIENYVGRGGESAVLGQASADFDRQTVDRAELEARAKAEGYTLTDADIARFTGQQDEVDTLDLAQDYFDDRYITRTELQDLAKQEGRTLTTADYSAYTGKVDDQDAVLEQASAKFSDPNTVDLSELQALADAEGYTLTDADIAAYTGRRNEAETLKGLRGTFAAKGVSDAELEKLRWAYGDPEMTREEALTLTTQYSDYLTKLPDADTVDYGEAKAIADSVKSRTGYVLSDQEIRSFMGVAPESGLLQRMTDYTDPRYIDITEARAAANAEGWYPTDDQLRSMGYVGKQDEATYLPQYKTEFDRRALSIPEVKAEAANYGYTLTDTDATNLKSALETTTPDKTLGYVENNYLPAVLDAQTVTADEIRDAFKSYGYEPTDDEVAAIQKNFTPPTISQLTTAAKNPYGTYNLLNRGADYYALGNAQDPAKPQGVLGYIDSTRIDNDEVKQWALDQGYDAATAAAVAASFQPISQPGVNLEGTVGAQLQQEFDRNAVSSSEAYDELIKAGVPADQILSGETAKFTGVGDEATKLRAARDYVDKVIVTPDEVREQLIAQGVPASAITNEMVTPFVRSDYIQRTTTTDPTTGYSFTRISSPVPREDAIFSSINTQYDPLYTNADEAEQAFKAAGYTPTPEEIAQFVGSGGEDIRLNQLKSYVDANTLDLTELQELAGIF